MSESSKTKDGARAEALKTSGSSSKKKGLRGCRELNRQIQALQSDKDCLRLENVRLLKKIEVLEEIKTALRKQQGKDQAKVALSLEMEHELKDLRMRLEVTQQQLDSAKKLKMGVNELRQEIATMELSNLQMNDKVKAVEALKDDFKIKLQANEALLRELCGLMVNLWNKQHPDEHPPSDPLALRDWIRGRMSSADAAKLAAEKAKKEQEASVLQLRSQVEELKTALAEQEDEIAKAQVQRNLDKARIEQLELELKSLYAAYSVVTEDVNQIESDRRTLQREKEERDREMAETLVKQESTRKMAELKREEEERKRDEELAKKLQKEEKERIKKKKADFIRRRVGTDEFKAADENTYYAAEDRSTGKTYYVNCVTMETTWHLPEGARVVSRSSGEPVAPRRGVSSGNSGNSTVSPRHELRQLEERLSRYYSFYKPDMVDKVRDIATRYLGQESKLFGALSQKYGVEPPFYMSGNLTLRKKKKGMLSSKQVYEPCWFNGRDGMLRCWTDEEAMNRRDKESMEIPLAGVEVKDEGTENGVVAFSVHPNPSLISKALKKSLPIYLCASDQATANRWILFLRTEGKVSHAVTPSFTS